MQFPSDKLDEIRERVKAALDQAGESPWLVGYDANAIQEMVTPGSRPIIMRGASQTIADFDKDERDQVRNVFAGGGRGISVVGSRDAAEEWVRTMPATFRKKTVVGVMAAAGVPLDRRRVGDSLRWLRRKLDVAKDAAGPPGGALPGSPADECVNCLSYRAAKTIEREGREERVCRRCYEMTLAGKQAREMSTALVDVSDCEKGGAHQGRLAAVSADGNNLGAFFDDIDSLEELAAASMAIDRIFQHAHEQALRAAHEACQRRFGLAAVKSVPLMIGGDDVRVFLPPSGLVAYVGTLAREVEAGAAAAGNLGGLLGPRTAEALRHLGVGIGAVVAEDHFPARRLMGYAHTLERRAKAICREPRSGVRSAVDIELVTSNQAVGVALEDRRAKLDGRPFPLDAERWSQLRKQAQALSALPMAQRRVLDDAHTLDELEFANLFRYQVARTKPWQRWYDDAGVDWRDAKAVIDGRPGAGLLALGSLLPEEKSP